MDADKVNETEIEVSAAATPKKSLGVLRIIILGVGGFCGTLAVIVASAFWATGGIVQTADSFFEKLRKKNVESAYDLGTENFKQSVGLKQFEAFSLRHRLSSYSSTTWTSREVSGIGDGASGKLEGSLVGDDGAVEPVSLSLLKQGGAWRIHGIDLTEAGVDPKKRGTEFDNSVPSERKLILLVQNSDMAFARAVDAGSMAGFHDHISRTWAQHHTVEQLDGFFGAFIEKQATLLPLKDSAPVFSKPAFVNDDGWLIVSGFYDTKPQRAVFTHKYVYEGFGWKLIGYSLELVSARTKQAHFADDATITRQG